VSKNFVVYGPRWRKHTLTSPTLFFRLKGTEIWGEALTRLYNQTRVVINVSVWGSEGAGANLRLLEVPACGACLLTDVVKDASLLLTPEKEFVGAADLPEMQQKLAVLLADEPRREEVARRGYEKAAHLRTYDHLVAQVCGDWARYREISGPG
jgi:spore maturation protein CgeB